MMIQVCPWQTLCFSVPIFFGWLELSSFTATGEIRKCICICGVFLHSEGDLREECNEKKCGTPLQRRAFSSIHIFESLLKGKFGMKLRCKSEVVIEDCFGTFHK